MYSSAFYKMEARNRLKGNYGYALIGTVIYLIPVYILYLIDTLTGLSSSNGTISTVIGLLFTVFVLNIFDVGYMRFLLNMKPADGEEQAPNTKKVDYNNILSGYTMNFKNTFKGMFTRDIYLFLWSLLAAVPILVYIGVLIYLAITTPIISDLYSVLLSLVQSPSPDMLENAANYISENCSFLPLATLGIILSTIACSLPLIYKSYEYAAVPMILAENPDMETKKVFERSYNIMHGFRWKYFCIELSFIGFAILAGLILIVTLSAPIYYLARLFYLPYMSMTLVMFYVKRMEIINHNISVYGEN